MSKTLQMVDGDFFVGADGRYVEIDGIDKTAQDIAEALLTEYDAQRDEGNALIGASTEDPRIIGSLSKAYVKREITAAIERLQRYQQRDPAITDLELIDRIRSLIVIVLPEKKTDANFFLEVEVVSGEVITMRKVVSLRQFQTPRGATPRGITS